MWKESAQKMLQGWSQAIRNRIKTPPKLQSGHTVENGSFRSEYERRLVESDHSYQDTAKKAIDTFKSSKSFESAKEYSSKLHQSGSQYATDFSKRIPRNFPTKSEWNEMSEPAKERMRQSMESASSYARRLANERITQPAQKAVRDSTEKASTRLQSASDRISLKASQLVQERIAQPAQRVLERSTQSAHQAIENSAKTATQSAKSATSQASSIASQIAESTKKTFVEELRSMRSDALRWLWWWSLAAIAVYGMATTLPGQWLRIRYEQSKDNRALQQQKQNETKQLERTEEWSTPSGFSGWFSWTQQNDQTAITPDDGSDAYSWKTLFQRSTNNIDNKKSMEQERSYFERYFRDNKEDAALSAADKSMWSWSRKN